MDNALLTETARLRKERWHTEECPPGCAYLAYEQEHVHERHDDGSLATLAYDDDGQWSLMEFQGTLW